MAVAIGELFEALQQEVVRLQHPLSEAAQEEMAAVLGEAIQLSLREVQEGAEADAFADLAVVNFIIQASREGYSTEEISSFVRSLSHPKLETATVTVI